MPQLKWKESRFLGVPLTDDEKRARGEQLASILKDAEEAEVRHKAEREKMKAEADRLESQIHRLGKIIREGVEERSVEVELRLDFGLLLVEEFRTDTGELLTSRAATPDDKLRAQARSQMTIDEVPEKQDETA